MNPIHVVVGGVLLLIYTGVAFRRKPKIHVPIMLTSFVLDLTTVLFLEFNRNVILKVAERAFENIVRVHLTFAICTLLGYGIALYTGRRLLKGAPIRQLHKINAIIFLVSRTGVFITSFWVIK